MSEPKPYTLAELEEAPVDDIWGTNSTRIVVTKESVAATINDNARLTKELAAERDENEQLKDIQRQILAASDANAHANARLRALIKEAEFADHVNGSAFCPWCDAEAAEGQRGHEDCPAFTPEGAVR